MPQSAGLQFTVTIGPLPRDLFAMTGFELDESLSSVFSGTLQLASRDPSIAPDEVLEQPVDLLVFRDGQPLRRFHGVVSEFARLDSGHRRTAYEVVIQPPLWRLGLMHNSRIFQAQSTDAIVNALLDERGITDTVFDLKRLPEEREYCVQHRESDLAFLERLAAEEGWHYRHTHGTADGEEPPGLVIADHHGDAPVLEPITYNARAGGTTRTDYVSSFAYQERVRVSSVVLKDYTFRNPAYALMHEAGADGVKHREDYQHYDYPGRFKADASGKPFTNARLDALRNDASTAVGSANRPDLVPGARLELQEHDVQALNREWLLTRVKHTGTQPQALEEDAGQGATTYSNHFEAVPADRTWRPAIPARPVMDGPRMAMVTGPEGEEIHCDEYGRVKVRFPWDRYSENNERSSAWLRVSQASAGGQYGFMALPRIGHEVIVSFLDGDPDQPIITGRTHHAANTPPYALPEHKTRTTLKTRTHKGEGSNELRFEDEAGKEQIYIHAQKDLDLLTENDRAEVVKNDSHLTVGNNRVSQVSANDNLTVDGDRKESVGADSSLTVNGNLHSQQGKAQLVEAGTEIHHKAGQKVVIETGAEITLKVGGNFIRVDPSGVTLSGPLVNMNNGGTPGVGTPAAAQVPGAPKTVTPDGVGKDEGALAETGQRQNTSGSGPAPVTSFATLLNQSANQGALVVSGCEYDENGHCTLHQHA
jgi:type VI secretion system secreted protein VgrG